MKKAIVFVDANNWYHNAKKFFNPSDVIHVFGRLITKEFPPNPMIFLNPMCFSINFLSKYPH